MRFDAKALAAALEPPVFIDLEGQEHRGLVLSHAQMTGFLDLFQGWAEGVKRDELDEGVRKLCDACQLPADKIVALPEPLYQKWLADFFGYLKGLRDPETPPTS